MKRTVCYTKQLSNLYSVSGTHKCTPLGSCTALFYFTKKLWSEKKYWQKHTTWNIPSWISLPEISQRKCLPPKLLFSNMPKKLSWLSEKIFCDNLGMSRDKVLALLNRRDGCLQKPAMGERKSEDMNGRVWKAWKEDSEYGMDRQVERTKQKIISHSYTKITMRKLQNLGEK